MHQTNYQQQPLPQHSGGPALNQSVMKMDEFYKLIAYKMDIVGRAREESYTKLHKILEGMPLNDPALPEIAKTVTETEKNLQDMMIVINNVVDLQLESYDNVNTMTMELIKKKQDAKIGRPKVTFVDEKEDKQEINDGASAAENNAAKKNAAEEDGEVAATTKFEKENKKTFIVPNITRQMPASPVLSSLANNSLLSSVKRPIVHSGMPTTPPTTHKSDKYHKANGTIAETPRMLNLDESVM